MFNMCRPHVHLYVPCYSLMEKVRLSLHGHDLQVAVNNLKVCSPSLFEHPVMFSTPLPADTRTLVTTLLWIDSTRAVPCRSDRLCIAKQIVFDCIVYDKVLKVPHPWQSTLLIICRIDSLMAAMLAYFGLTVRISATMTDSSQRSLAF